MQRVNPRGLFLQCPFPATISGRVPRCVVQRLYSSASSATPSTTSPPLLAKIKADLKPAMKAKDAPRLVVLRGILAATLNASKTKSPIQTDLQLVALLRKTSQASKDAASQFREAGRADLAEKEEAQVQILEEYASGSGIEKVSLEELHKLVLATFEELAAEDTASGKTGKAAKAKAGEVIKRLLGPGGKLYGKDIDKAELSRIVKEADSSS